MPAKRTLLTIVVVCVALLAAGACPQPAGSTRARPATPAARPGGVTIPYAGRLTDPAGNPVADGLYDFALAAYAAETGGEPLWSEVQPAVPVAGGAFAAALGAVQPLPTGLAGGPTLWLAVSVRGPGESEFTALAPRQPVSAAAPAAAAGIAAASSCPHDHGGEAWNLAIPWSNAGLRINNSANGPSIWGWNTGGGNGLRGDSYGSGIGVYGEGEDGAGVVGRSTNGYGVEGASGLGSGVYAHSVYGNGLFAHSDNSSSLYVDGAGQNGLYVASAGEHGVYVASAGWSGVAVNSAAGAGMWVHSAALDGLLIDTAGWDGVHVVGPVGGTYYGSGKVGDEDFAVLNTGEVRSKVGFAAPANDYAITMPVVGDRDGYEPGDVLVVSALGGGAAERSTAAYSPAVVGVYSAAPAFVGGRTVTGDGQSGGLPVAILGAVPCKVSAENGAVRPGDLLVTAATPGHAMRAGGAPAAGTVLGKALGALDGGTGIILVLVTLR